MDCVLAIDLGASGGRVIRGTWDPSTSKLELKEIHRFANEPVELLGTLHWDTLRLWFEIQKGIREAVRTLPAGDHIRSLAVDTWGVDFGLLDSQGHLLGNPVHYRDKRTDGQVAKLTAELGDGMLFRRTGIQDAWFNTVGQLRGALEHDPRYFDAVEALLFTPDLFNYFFSGRKAAERTIASTSQLLSAGQLAWDADLIGRLRLPLGVFQALREPATLLGAVLPEVAHDLGLEPSTQVALVPSHDTESAAVAVPSTSGASFAFISCGTWAVLGAELLAPVLTDEARLGGFSNEAGAFGTNLLLKNIMGMWLVQECKRWWEREGQPLGHGDLVEWAKSAPPGGSVIDVNHAVFSTPGDMPGRIEEFCRKTGQPVPQGRGEIVLCVLESLACEFRRSVEQLEAVTATSLSELWLVGGGSQNRLLCQLTADLTGRVVLTGPVETTAIGNLACQFVALGTFSGAKQAREVVSRSFGVERFDPSASAAGEGTYRRWLALAR